MRKEYLTLVENCVKKIVSENIEKEQINYYLQQFNDEVTGYLGKGDYGTAFLTKNEKVVKVTSLKKELEVCKEIKLHPKENLVRIFDVNDEHNFIYQEYVEEDSSIEDLYYQVSNILEQSGLSIPQMNYFDEDEYEEQNGPIEDEIKNFMNELSAVLYDAQQFVQYPDLKPDNLGRDQKGTLKFFDIVGDR